MSGFDVIGVVLAVVPLVISALEHYEKGVSAIFRYQHYKREVKDITLVLRTEEALYSNICELLLSDIVSPDELRLLLEDLGGSRWSDPELSVKLKTRLGHSYNVYMGRVQDIASVFEEFKVRLDLDDNGKVYLNGGQ
jgi:hypothetical protein